MGASTRIRVMIGPQINFKRHLDHTCQSIIDTSESLAWMMVNITRRTGLGESTNI